MEKINLKLLKGHMGYYWKTQSTKGAFAQCVAYVDARHVAEKLDEVVGPGGWEERYERDSKGGLWCYLTIWVDGRPVTKADVGTPSDFESTKGEASDAFKRAAVKWGVGRFLYDLPIMKLKVGEYNGKKYPATHDGEILFNKNQLNAYINSIRQGNKKQQGQNKPAQEKSQPVASNGKALDLMDIKKLVDNIKTVTTLNKTFRALPEKQRNNTSVITIFTTRKAEIKNKKKTVKA